MADKDMVTQCQLTSGRMQHVAYIPKAMARLGGVITIDSMPGEWTVTAVYASMTAAEANDRSRDHTKQREFSDA